MRNEDWDPIVLGLAFFLPMIIGLLIILLR